MAFNPLTTNAADLQHQLHANKLTSVQIVTEYLAQISQHESALNAFISVAPHEILLQTASQLDEECQTGHVRSPLHGIPIVLKDCFITSQDLGMGTTAGSWAFVGARAKSNSPIVQRLIDAGMIILGKTNMTEFAGMKMTMMMPGWSAHGGQTLSPYVGEIEDGETILGHSAPGGSSTGSAVAVAAGFSPLAMGAETIGSIITPGSRAALYALKPTVGVQDLSGMYSLTEFFDSPGPMAKSSEDLIALTEVLLGRSYPSARVGTWDGLPVGFLDPRVWKTGEEMVCRHHEGTAEQMVEDYEAMVTRLREKGCVPKYPVGLEETTALVVDGEPAIMTIAYWEFRNICIPRFLESFEEVSVHSLEDIVKFNDANKEKCLPEPYTEQNDLLKALYNNDQVEHIEHLKKELRSVAKKILDKVFDQERVSIIAGPADSPLCVHAAAAGYPVGTVPMSQLRYNGRPFGLCIVGKENDEETLLRFMCAYEESSGPRAVPKLEVTGSA